MLATALLLAAPMLLQADETVKDFRRFYKKEKDPLAKTELIHSLEGIEDPGVSKVLMPLLDDKDPLQVEASLKVLAKLREAPSRVPMMEPLIEGKPTTLIAPILQCAADAGWKEFAPLAQPYLVHKDDTVRLWAITLIGTGGYIEALPDVALMVTEDDHPLVRAAAVQTLIVRGKGREEICGPPLVAALKDESISVSTAACIGLRKVRVKEAIGPLIEIFQNGDGRIMEEVWPTLVALTDEPFGPDAEMWAKWWGRVEASYTLLTDAEINTRKAARTASNAQYTLPSKEATFMGVDTSSRQIVFVIDVSGSMEEEVTAKDAFRERGFTKFRKLDIVKEELSRSIDQLGPNVYFNVYSFATKVHPWRKKPVPANALNKRSAMAWVGKLKPVGGGQAAQRASAGLRGSSGLEDGRTNTYAALLAGLGIEDDPKKRGPVTEAAAADPKEVADTMFFLSDGKPTVGELVDTEDILQSINSLNRFRKVVIHTIAIGDFTSSFIKQLSMDNGGVFVDLGR
jgi:HEAT repeat protein